MNPARLRVLGTLGDRYSQLSWLQPVLDKLGPPIHPREAEALLAPDCDGLVVLDDCGNCESVQAALALRRVRPELQIAVVKLIDRGWSDAECLTRVLTETDPQDHHHRKINERQLGILMGAGGASLEVQIDPDAIKFEYQG